MVSKIMPISPSKTSSEYEEVSVEYSIALEYKGPAVDRSIPHVLPLDLDRIPTAKPATPASALAGLALPVVQPISRNSKVHVRDVNGGSSGSPSSLKAEAEGTGDRVSTSRISNEFLGRVVDGTESSGTLGFSDSREHSRELSGSSDMLETPLHCEDNLGSQRYVDQIDSMKRSPTPQPFSVEVSSSCEEDSDNESLHRTRKVNVTFVEPDSSEMVNGEDEDEEEGDSISGGEGPVRLRMQVPERVVKKGLCFRCLKGNRLTDKEVCLVCDAKYCSNCILRAMGSMPEGRKCLTCIGYPIDESKRKSLGRCSRMLKRLLSEDGVKLIMHSERYCAANQIPSELVYVNGKPLSEYELTVLLNCEVPPKKLKPGRYWYDKVSGFWGKEGHRPSQIITDKLDVGDDMKADASNGDTSVFINNRRITQAELWMLKSAGVQCAGVSYLWLEADGTYREEGMKDVKKSIWGKKRTKALCSLLSLPTPESQHFSGTMPNHNEDVPDPDQKSIPKLLLVGNDQSGTCTIFKQARLKYNLQFSEEERESTKFMIQSKLYGYLAVLLEGREQFEEESLAQMRGEAAAQPGPSEGTNAESDKTVYSISAKLRSFSDWLVNIMLSGNLDTIFPAATREYAPYVEELWKDSAIQAAYSRIDELGLPTVAKHVLNKAVEIAKVDYEPSDTDILYADGITSSNGLAHVEFSFPRTAEDGITQYGEQPNPVTRCELIRVDAKSLGRECKYLDMFEDVSVILFCVSLSDYNEFESDINGDMVNKMMASKNLFETIINHPTFSDSIFLLILNKFDLLEEKLDQVPLTTCEWFSDFNPVLSRHPNHRSTASGSTPPLSQRAFHYVAVKFKRLFKSLTGRNLYVCRTAALDQKSVDEAMRYAREIVRWEEEKHSLSLSHGLNEMSSESMEASSS